MHKDDKPFTCELVVPRTMHYKRLFGEIALIVDRDFAGLRKRRNLLMPSRRPPTNNLRNGGLAVENELAGRL